MLIKGWSERENVERVKGKVSYVRKKEGKKGEKEKERKRERESWNKRFERDLSLLEVLLVCPSN